MLSLVLTPRELLFLTVAPPEVVPLVLKLYLPPPEMVMMVH
jgi:hypothetical protein